MKLRERFLALFAVAALLPVGIAGLASYLLIRQSIIDRTVSTLDALAAIQESRVEEIIRQNAERLNAVSTRADLRLALAAYPASGLSEMEELLTDSLSFSDATRRIAVTDRRGVIIASTDATETGTDISGESYYQSGNRAALLSDVVRDRDGLLVFRLVGPVYSGGTYAGTVVLETDASNLFAIARDYRGLGRTGETIIARPAADGGAEVIAPMRSDAGAALSRVVADAADGERPIILEALGRREETFTSLSNFRGVPVFAATRFVDTPGYGISVQLDEEEALEPLVPLRSLLFEALIAAVMVAVILSLLAARRLSAPITRLTAAARRIAEGSESTRVPAGSSDETGDLARSFNIMVDKLLAERLRLEASVKGMPVGILLVGEDDEILLRNDHLSHILELRDGSSSLAEVVRAVPSSLGFRARISECVRKGRVIEMKDVAIGDRTVRLLLSPIRGAEGRSHGFVLLTEDVSEARRLEQAKTEFVSVASHQLRTPLTAIKGGTSMLLDRDLGPLNDQQAEFLTDIQQSNDRMIALVNSLLNISRIDLGLFAVDPEPTELKDIADVVLKELAGTVKAKNQVLSSALDATIGPVSVDRKLMQMVFTNLLSNAVKYTPSGGKIGFELRKEGDRIVITVSDSGYGIPASQQPKIFTKMFRADNARKHDPDGSGLGLYIVKAIVESTGGTIGFRSVEGKGTVFSVSMPASGMKKKAGEKKLQ